MHPEIFAEKPLALAVAMGAENKQRKICENASVVASVLTSRMRRVSLLARFASKPKLRHIREAATTVVEMIHRAHEWLPLRRDEHYLLCKLEAAARQFQVTTATVSTATYPITRPFSREPDY